MAPNRYVKGKDGKLRGSLPSEQALRAPSASDLPAGGASAVHGGSSSAAPSYQDMYSRVADAVTTPVNRWKEGTNPGRLRQVKAWLVTAGVQVGAFAVMASQGDNNTRAALMGAAAACSVGVVAAQVANGRREGQLTPALRRKEKETGIKVEEWNKEVLLGFDNNGLGNWHRSADETVDRLYAHMQAEASRSRYLRPSPNTPVSAEVRSSTDGKGVNITYRQNGVPLHSSFYAG